MIDLKITDVEKALKELSKANGFEWDFWLIVMLKLHLEQILEEKNKRENVKR